MAAPARVKRKAPPPPTLAPGKGQELLGVALAIVAALLLASLLSHHPDDPSILHQTGDVGAGRHNVIGPVGAQISAVGFGLLGICALLVPLLLIGGAWRRLRRDGAPKVVGRALGGVIVLAALPPLLQLTLGEISWRGEAMPAGGAFGRLLADALESYLGFTGSLLILLGAVVAGATLLVQSTLGELLARWGQRLSELWQRLVLSRARHRERRDKEKSRQKVMDKHLKRVARETRGRGGKQAAPAIDLPLRVVEKEGAGGFKVRKVKAVTPPPAPRSKAKAKVKAKAPAKNQRQIPLVDETGPTTLPPVNLLQVDPPELTIEENDLVRLGERIRERCAEFGVQGSVDAISPGPVITVFEFQPAPGVKVSQIVNLQDDLALALKAESVRIDRIPGRSTLGIEVPNKSRSIIHLGHLLAQEGFKRSPSLLTMAIGTTIQGEPHYADLATMPHLLVAGATGSGKSVGLQSMITSIIYKAMREDVQFIFIDPKRIELGVYKDIPHLKTEVVVEPSKAANALRWAVAEMERRYRLLAEMHVRSIDHYNRAVQDPSVQRRLALSESDEEKAAEELRPLPYYVIVIDELADLMMVASSEVESAIARLAQMARAVGLHLIVATQRPSVDVLTGTIKANFPCRISYATATRHDSRTILDQVGAEKLLGKGDALFMPPGTSRIVRLHGAYVSEQETAALVRWLKKQGKPQLDPEVVKPREDPGAKSGAGEADDDMFEEAARLVVSEGQASASFLQRRLRVGFSRAARLIDIMERDGLLGPPQGSKPREVLVKPDFFEEWDAARRGIEA